MKKALNILIVCVSFWCAGIILTPIATSVFPTFEPMTNILYRFYGVVCHQFDSRSFHIHHQPFAVCIRCTAIYGGFLLALIAIRISSRLSDHKFDPIIVLICSLTPMALDVLGSFTTFHEISTPSRLISGAIFGIGLAILLHRSLTEIISSLIKEKFYEIKTR